VLWPKVNKEQGYNLMLMEIVKGVFGNARGPCQPPELFGHQISLEQRKTPQSVCGARGTVPCEQPGQAAL